MVIFFLPDASSSRTRRITDRELVPQLVNSRFVHGQFFFFFGKKMGHIFRNSFLYVS